MLFDAQFKAVFRFAYGKLALLHRVEQHHQILNGIRIFEGNEELITRHQGQHLLIALQYADGPGKILKAQC